MSYDQDSYDPQSEYAKWRRNRNKISNLTNPEVVLSSNNYRRWFTVKNEADAKHVIIVSRKNQYLPNSTLTKDYEEEEELRQLREMMRR